MIKTLLKNHKIKPMFKSLSKQSTKSTKNSLVLNSIKMPDSKLL